jgi:hypothetical protein
MPLAVAESPAAYAERPRFVVDCEIANVVLNKERQGVGAAALRELRDG